MAPPNGFAPRPDAIAITAMRAFCLEMWRRRAVELRLPMPKDLSSSCVFTALFIQSLHGGEIRGNWEHFHIRLPDGTSIDLNDQAADVLAIRARGADPHLHDRRLVASRDVRESFDSCRPRVAAWVREWHATNGCIDDGRDGRDVR